MTDQQMKVQLFASLTGTQVDAANWQTGPVLVLAGPGSGKTRVLTARVAKIVSETESQSFRVLSLTFTNRAADEMRQRVDSAIGLTSATRLFVGTFHSFCADVLRNHGVHVQIKPDFRIYGKEAEKLEVLRKAVTNAQLADADSIDLKNMLHMIDAARSELLPWSGIAKQRGNRPEDIEFEAFYKAYNEELRRINALDFESIIFEAHRLFSSYKTVATHYQRTYTHWCIDEFQDTNYAQYQLLKAMAGGGFREIFVVADDDQIIYQWNGASHERLKQFVKDFDAKVLQLPANYRCPRSIVELANRLIQNNFLRTDNKLPLVPMKTANQNDDVLLQKYDDDVQEAKGIAEYLKQHISYKSESTVVLARARYLLDRVKGALNEAGISSTIVQRLDEFQSLPFVWIHACLRLANRRVDDQAIEAVVGSFNEMFKRNIDVGTLRANASTTHADYLRQWMSESRLETEDSTALELVASAQACLLLKNDYKGFVDRSLRAFNASSISDESNIFSGYADDKLAWAELSRDITNTLMGHESLDSFLQELNMRSKQAKPRTGTVTLMTIHAAKGNEFDNVILMGLAEDILPSYRSKARGERTPELEEERRNCFVAITRTERRLILSYADKYNGWKKQPSRFLKEMGLI